MAAVNPKYNNPAYVRKVKIRYRRAWLAKHGKASSGSYSRNNLSGMGDDHYSWERRRPSVGYSSDSLFSVKSRFASMMGVRRDKKVASQYAKGLLHDRKYEVGGKRGWSSMSGGTVNKATAAKNRRSLVNQSERYKRMWATRKKKYGKSGGKKRGKRSKGGRR